MRNSILVPSSEISFREHKLGGGERGEFFPAPNKVTRIYGFLKKVIFTKIRGLSL